MRADLTRAFHMTWAEAGRLTLADIKDLTKHVQQPVDNKPSDKPFRRRDGLIQTPLP